MNRLVKASAVAVALALVNKTSADITVGVDPTQSWLGYMNVYELPGNGGGYDFGQVWGFNDLKATFTTGALTLGPNTSIDRDSPLDTFWWQDNSGNSPGNKMMDASAYVENNTSLPGNTVDFVGSIASNSLISPYATTIFIKQYTTSFALVSQATAPATAGAFDLTLPTSAGNIVQYGFETVGPDARLAATGLGNVVINTIAASTTSLWSVGGDGNWNVAANWQGGIPNAVGEEADLFSAINSSSTVYTDTPITLTTLNFNNSNTYVVTGAGSLTLQASTGPATIIVQQGSQKIDLPLTIASNTSFNVASGATLVIANPLTINAGLSVTKTGAGTVTYQSTVTLLAGASVALASSANINALSLATGASASITSSGPTRSLLQTTSLSLASGSTLNLANSDLVVHGGNIGTVTAQVKSGFNGGTWSGTGINSSTAAANTTHLTALGAISNNTGSGVPIYGTGSALGSFDGISPALNDVLVRYTYYGDTNLDGKVDGSDYSRIDNGYLGKLTGWQNGDLNYDGSVNGSDYTLMDNAYNRQGGPIASASSQTATETAQIASIIGTSAVPEPTTLALLRIGTIALLGRRRSR